MHRVTKKELEKKVDYINFKLGIDTGLKGSYILYKDHGGYELAEFAKLDTIEKPLGRCISSSTE